jgi:hypothetical protein
MARAKPIIDVGINQAQPDWRPHAQMRRRRLFDLSPMVHCSVVGTCLTAGELRKVLRKFLGAHADRLSEHDLHFQGVRLASVSGHPSKSLNKLLDEKHHSTIARFSEAKTEWEVAQLWETFKAEGHIEGAYWSLATHPFCGEALFQRVFGEIHMLSHLMGASNRADIRKLVALEAELGRAKEEADKVRATMRVGFSQKDREINRLQTALVSSHESPRNIAVSSDEVASLRSTAAKFQQRFQAAEIRIEKLSRLLSEARLERDDLAEKLFVQQQLVHELQADVLDLEERLAGQENDKVSHLSLAGMTVLYVGGRTSSIPRLRQSVERRHGRLIHHDGGQAQNVNLLGGLIGSADCVVFPVECVSHQAMQILKKRCLEVGKPFFALPSTGTASLMRVLEGIEGNRVERNARNSPSANS